MVDLYKEAKNRLKAKKMGKDSKLSYGDIRDLILLAMIDGVLDKSEIKELKEISRYTFGNMEADGVALYNNFMDGALGTSNTKAEAVDIVGKASGMLAAKNIKDQPLIFQIDEVSELLLMSIRDGKLTADKVDQLVKLKDILNGRVNQAGLDLFMNFARAYHSRLYPPNQTKSQTSQTTSQNISQTQSQATSSNTSQTQCGYCYGSGSITCGSCYGTGGQSETRTEYDYDGNVNYRTEFVNCFSCNGGYERCGTCGGSGQVYI